MDCRGFLGIPRKTSFALGTFRDGTETSRFGSESDPVAESFGRYLLIDSPAYTVSAGVMRSAKSGELSSASVMTIQFAPNGDGTLPTLIDGSVYFGTDETSEMREQGCGPILDKLTAHLSENRSALA